ncbi:ABC transporter permease [Roseivirga sp.]|uniref:ABC transporter permease n=1 Tax=Roseivirga sp. TaxID=1964215 RepID=UPI003B8BDD0F
MLKSYLLISLRNIRGNKGSSVLNILCLTLGMATCLFIFNYVRFEYSYDSFHEKAKQIHRIETDTYFRQEIVKTNAFTKFGAAADLKNTFSEIDNTARLIPFSENSSAFLLSRDIDSTKRTTFVDKAYYSESSFFDIFSLEWLEKDEDESLLNENGLVVSTTTAERLFPKLIQNGKSILGQKVNIRISSQNEETWTIQGVFEPLPKNSHLTFGALFSLSGKDFLLNSNSQENTYTYALVNDDYDRQLFKERLVDRDSLSELSYKQLDYLSLRPLREIHTSTNVSNDPGQSAKPTFILFLIVMGSIILILAATNYINSSIINSIERSKEVGIRKLLGVRPIQLIFNILVESGFINLISGLLALGVFLFGVRSVDVFTTIDYPNVLNANVMVASGLSLVVIIIIAAILSGYFPARLLINLKPIEAMRGKNQVVNSKQSSKGSGIMRILLVFQITVSIIFVSGLFIVQKQLNYVKDKENKSFRMNLTAKFPGLTGANDDYARQIQGFISALIKDDKIESADISNLYNGQIKMRQAIKPLYQVGGDTTALVAKFDLFVIDYQYFDGLKEQFLAGTNFNRRFGYDYNSVIINESALEAMRFASPDSALSKFIRPYNGPLKIKGIIKNDSTNDIPKVYVTGLRYPTYFDITILARGNSAEKLNTAVTTAQNNLNRQLSGIYFLTRKYDQQLTMEKNLVKIFFAFTLMAVFIASLGIFGLSSFTALKRAKEISIRKILGANIQQILYLLVHDFLRLMFIGSAIAIPMVFYAAREWLENYAFRINLHLGITLLPILIMCLLSISIIVRQSWSTSIQSPLQSLRSS